MKRKTLCHLALSESEEFKIVIPSKKSGKIKYKLYSPQELGMFIIPSSDLPYKTNMHKRERSKK